MYVYQADCYCDSCGARICADLAAEGLAPADPSDQWSYDSDNYPKSAAEDVADYPNHCASGADCLEAIDLLAYGLPTIALAPVLEGAETQRVGAILEGLTEEGESYTRELMAPATLTYSRGIGNGATHERRPSPYQQALYRLWAETFDL
jgi:hypothetical protein